MAQQLAAQQDRQAQVLRMEPRGGDTAIRFKRFCVFPRTRQMLADGQPIAIGSRAFDLLVALLEARGALVTKNEIMDRVWPTTVVDESNLRVQMGAVRRALGRDRDLLKNIPGRGYVLAVESGAGPSESRAPMAPTPQAAASLDGHESATLEPVHEQLRRAQAQLACIARLATKVELTASVTHEVTARLTAIVANAQGCLLWLASDGADPEGEDAADYVVRNARLPGEAIRGIHALAAKSSSPAS